MSRQKTLTCRVCNSRNYQVNISSQETRLMIKKFCQKCKKHTEHQEEK